MNLRWHVVPSATGLRLYQSRWQCRGLGMLVPVTSMSRRSWCLRRGLSVLDR